MQVQAGSVVQQLTTIVDSRTLGPGFSMYSEVSRGA